METDDGRQHYTLKNKLGVDKKIYHTVYYKCNN